VVERMESKSEAMLNTLTRRKNDWEETFYEHLARNFGFKINAVPFEMLAKSVPLAVILKHRDNLLQLEALLFGQAGMLDKTFEETYPKQLQNEYRFLKQKFGLRTMDGHVWKFLR